MLDYLGYGATIGTWFLGGGKPLEVTSVVDAFAGLEVDEHSITVARYEFGLSKFETRWGNLYRPLDRAAATIMWIRLRGDRRDA